MRSAAQKSTRSLQTFRGRLLKIRIIPRGILRKVYSAIPHKNVSNLCQVPYVFGTCARYCNCDHSLIIHHRYLQFSILEVNMLPPKLQEVRMLCVYTYRVNCVGGSKELKGSFIGHKSYRMLMDYAVSSIKH